MGFGISSIIGFKNVNSCRSAKALRDAAFFATLLMPDGDRPDVTLHAIRFAEGSDTLRVGESSVLRATALRQDGAAIAGRTFQWGSTDANVLSVDVTGAITTKTAGTATIRAMTGGVVGTKSVVIVP